MLRRTIQMAFVLFTLGLGLVMPLESLAQGPPSGKVYFEYGSGAFILSASGGQGTLHFQGHVYPFKLGGMGIGGIGVAKIKGSGQIYNLHRLEDFPGGYVQARAGYAAGSGKGVLWLENTKGVVLKLHTTAKGLSLNLGADGLLIEMGYPKKK